MAGTVGGGRVPITFRTPWARRRWARAAGCMSASLHWGPIAIWHHRLLGGLWALCGVATFVSVLIAMVQHGSWVEYQLWISLFVALAYVVTGIGFILARTWARRTMGVLMVVAVLLAFDMMVPAGMAGDRLGVRAMLVAAGMAGYTLLFLA